MPPFMPRRLVLSVALSVLVLASWTQAPATPPFFFLQMSDPQFGMFAADKDFAQETANFEMAIATANRLKPAFVIVTGDLVNKPGDAAQIAEYHRIAARLDPSIPLYNVAGNHDVQNEPTPASVAAYVASFGRDYYSFRVQSLYGIVLDSSLIHSPDRAGDLPVAQATWLRRELQTAKSSGARHIVVFQHHPWFLDSPDEADQYFNIPIARRRVYLDLFEGAGVRYLMSGHYHRNALGRAGEIRMITSGPVGMPLGEGSLSGIRVGIVRDGGIETRFYSLGELPNKIDISEAGGAGGAR
jgi:3',5'-cyclic AMP phosphodiesterase CpdA